MIEKYVSADKLHTDLFSEESNSFYDSYADVVVSSPKNSTV